jgi:hypothetical protein
MHNWNQEIISKFYSTLFYDKKEMIFMWMINDRRFHVNLTQFAQIIGLSSQLDIPKKLHSRRVIMLREMTPMYIQDGGFEPPKIEGLLSYATSDDEEDPDIEDWLFRVIPASTSLSTLWMRYGT